MQSKLLASLSPNSIGLNEKLEKNKLLENELEISFSDLLTNSFNPNLKKEAGNFWFGMNSAESHTAFRRGAEEASFRYQNSLYDIPASSPDLNPAYISHSSERPESSKMESFNSGYMTKSEQSQNFKSVNEGQTQQINTEQSRPQNQAVEQVREFNNQEQVETKQSNIAAKEQNGNVREVTQEGWSEKLEKIMDLPLDEAVQKDIDDIKKDFKQLVKAAQNEETGEAKEKLAENIPEDKAKEAKNNDTGAKETIRSASGENQNRNSQSAMEAKGSEKAETGSRLPDWMRSELEVSSEETETKGNHGESQQRQRNSSKSQNLAASMAVKTNSESQKSNEAAPSRFEAKMQAENIGMEGQRNMEKSVKEARAKAKAPAQLTRSQAQENIDKLVKQTKLVIKNKNSGTISIRLNPKEFGRVDLKFEIIDNKISATALVETKEARQFLQNNLAELFRNFEKSGYQMDELQLEFFDHKEDEGYTLKGNEQNDGDDWEDNGSSNDDLKDPDELDDFLEDNIVTAEGLNIQV